MARTQRTSKPNRAESGFETLKTFGIAILIALFIRTFFVQAFRIPSGSMEDTLLIGDFLLVDKVTFGAKIPGTDLRLPGFRDPRRGDIIVFKDPRTNRDFIKRCIARDGETIRLADNQVFIDGQALAEPYKAIKPVPGAVRSTFGPYRVADDALFMMGDNRNNSQDSRYWGDLTPDRVVGRAFVLYWSTDPYGAPRWVQNMDETWVKGFFSLFLGRPRIRRAGTWLARNWAGTYQEGFAAARSAEAPSGAASAAGDGSLPSAAERPASTP